MPTYNTTSAELRVGDAVWPMTDAHVGLTDVVPGSASCEASWRLAFDTHQAHLQPGEVSVSLAGQVGEGFLDGVPAPFDPSEVLLISVSQEEEHLWTGGQATWSQTGLDVVLALRDGSWCLDQGDCEVAEVDLVFTLREELAPFDACFTASGPDAFGRCVPDGVETAECQGTLP